MHLNGEKLRKAIWRIFENMKYCYPCSQNLSNTGKLFLHAIKASPEAAAAAIYYIRNCGAAQTHAQGENGIVFYLCFPELSWILNTSLVIYRPR